VTGVDAAAEVRRFLRYGVVGLLGTAVHFVSTIALVELVGLDPVVASICGFLAAVGMQFALNRSWVFASRVPLAPGLVRYLGVSLLGFALNVAIMAIVTRWLELDYRIGLALVVLVLPAVNYVLNARWTFRS
jgi:putative flippase GtrA